MTAAETARGLVMQLRDAAEMDRAAVVAACDAVLEVLAPPHPELAPFHEAFREEADWWADVAPKSMQIAYLAAILRRLTNDPPVATTARKRAMVVLWNSLSSDERKAFLAKVAAPSESAT